VRYAIHVALDDDVAAGDASLSYLFEFQTEFVEPGTILQAFLGTIDDVFGANQNLRQTYTVTRVDRRSGDKEALGEGMVPPNNQGLVTPSTIEATTASSLPEEG
jgi:Domain of unknown function (DUF4331)